MAFRPASAEVPGLDAAGVIRSIAEDPWRVRALEQVASLELPDAWIVAGFIRCRVWDVLHGYDEPPPPSDIDVVFFDPERPASEEHPEDLRQLAWREIELAELPR